LRKKPATLCDGVLKGPEGMFVCIKIHRKPESKLNDDKTARYLKNRKEKGETWKRNFIVVESSLLFVFQKTGVLAS